MIVAAVALAVGLLGPWPVARLSRRGGSPRLAVAAQMSCLLLAWSGLLVLVADVAAPHEGVVRACATVFAALASGEWEPVPVMGAVAYLAVVGRTGWCLARVTARSRRTVEAVKSVARFDGTAWRISGSRSVGFTAGLVRPVVVVSDDLTDRVDERTREVVVAHELAHARGRHTAVDLLARALAAGVAPWPGARLAMLEVRRNLEAAADDYAARQYGAATVAHAIGQVALTPSAPLAAGTLGATDWPVWRVRRLLRPHRVSHWHRMPASAAAASSFVVGAQGAVHALMGSHLLPVVKMCPL